MSSCCPVLKAFLHPFTYVNRNGSSRTIPKREQRNIIIAAISATIFVLPVLYVLAAWRRRHYYNLTNPNHSSKNESPTVTKTRNLSPSASRTSHTDTKDGADFLASVTPDNITSLLDVNMLGPRWHWDHPGEFKLGPQDFLFMITSGRECHDGGYMHYSAGLFDPREQSHKGASFWIQDGKFACRQQINRAIHQFNTLKDYIDWLCKGEFYQGEDTRVKGNYVFKKLDGQYIRYRNPFVT